MIGSDNIALPSGFAASDAPFRALIERSADGVIVLRTNGVICLSNPAAQEMLGFTAQQLHGELFGVPVVPGGKAEVNILRGGVPSRTAEIRVVDITWEGDPALLATLRDVTQLKAAVEEAKLAVRRRDQFLAMLSHELRNPLGAISSAMDLMERPEVSAEAVLKAHRVVSRQIEQMSHLIDDLLDVSRVTQGKIELKRRPLAICHLVRDAVETVRALIDERRQHLYLDAADDTLVVDGDSSRLQQIVVNLLTNAVKYTPPGGCISVTVRRNANNEAVVQVQDSGKGVPTTMLESIFDMFVQADETLDRTQGGLGVGLTLVRALVTMHGGTVRAKSAGRGRGTTFEVRLPLVAVQLPVPVESVETFLLTECRRILVVDDNADCREMLQMLLELDGYEVSTAEDGFSALESIRRIQPDVALVDIGLPGVDGYQVARHVRQDSSLQHVHLVALTGYGRPADRQAAMAAGFDAHLVKPLDPNELAKILAGRRPRQSTSRRANGRATSESE
jgi:signal transduction histidine kinase/ActR/RegA family two-component response regulator